MFFFFFLNHETICGKRKAKAVYLTVKNGQFSSNQRAGPTYNIKDYNLFVVDYLLAINILKSISILHFLLSNVINIMKFIWRIMFF